MIGYQRLIDARNSFIRAALARGLYDNQIFDACEASPLFEKEIGRKIPGQVRRRRKLLTRGSIRLYVYRVRRDLREVEFDGRSEIHAACERLMHAFQIAAKKADVSGMVKVQRELSRIYGFGKSVPETDSFSAEDVQAQLRQMDLSIGL